ncbi:MAG: fructosamine kinase family protein, partial [Fimbriimonadaceae bacterium]|nr:fructosamine kinase family protein [Chitinophagales bacterium]
MMQGSFSFKDVAEMLSVHFNKSIEVTDYQNVSGGCINACFVLETNAAKYFLKKNNAHKFPGMFSVEARGLQLLSGKATDFIPQVILQFEKDDVQYLILEYIEQGRRSENFWNDFAKQLSDLHRNTNDKFGLDHDNYMGSLHQKNSWCNSFNDFFILRRIEPLLKLAIEKKELPDAITKNFEKLFDELDNIFPIEKPALIHGDLWGGNFMINKNGRAIIIDPAVAYSHRECDLAMTKLF